MTEATIKEQVRALYLTLHQGGSSLDEPTFRHFVLTRASTAADLGALHAADLYLAAGLSIGDAAALLSFEKDHLQKCALYLAKHHPSSDTIDEVKQRTRERLFVASDHQPAKIHQYSGKHAFDAWLRAVVVSVYQNFRRAQKDHENVDLVPLAAMSSLSPELQLMRGRLRHVFNDALSAAFTSLDSQARQLLRLKYGQGLTLDAMALVINVHRATVARQLAQASDHLWQALISSLSASLKIDEREIAALARELRSQLDISLSGLLRTREE